jgi:hypothetical protein
LVAVHGRIQDAGAAAKPMRAVVPRDRHTVPPRGAVQLALIGIAAAARSRRDRDALASLERPRGRRKTHPLMAENAQLQQRAERAEAELAKARRVIEVQGNVSALWANCSSPGARRRTGAASDDRAGRERTHTGGRYASGVTGPGYGSRDGLSPPAPAAPRQRKTGPQPKRALSYQERYGGARGPGLGAVRRLLARAGASLVAR